MAAARRGIGGAVAPQANGLTAREREVAALVGLGMTDRQIAAALVISAGTATTHVKHILRKLGLAKRSQIAVFAATSGWPVHAAHKGDQPVSAFDGTKIGGTEVINLLQTAGVSYAPGPSRAEAAAVPARFRRLGRTYAATAAAVLALAFVASLIILRAPQQSASGSGSAVVQSASVPAASSPWEPVPTEPQTLPRADDFSDPAGGLFSNNQRGTSTGGPNGESYQAEWEYAYSPGALLARLAGPYPEVPQPLHFVGRAASAVRPMEDFAAEVTAQATRSPRAAELRIRYAAALLVSYDFWIGPGSGDYGIWVPPARGQSTTRTLRARNLVMGRSPAIHRGYDENRLRLEVRGDTMRMFVNGEELGQARDDEVALRGGRVELIWDMSGPPEDGDVEVRFTNFKVSSLVR